MHNSQEVGLEESSPKARIVRSGANGIGLPCTPRPTIKDPRYTLPTLLFWHNSMIREMP